MSRKRPSIVHLKQDAYREIYGKSSKIENDVLYEIGRRDGEVEEPSEEETKAITAKADELMKEWEAQEYSWHREREYPNFNEQLDKIYHDGVAKWKSEMIDPIKTKWPKDNSGPVE